MSRIGKKPIAVPAGVDVSIDGQHVVVKKGNEKLDMVVHPNVRVAVEDGVIHVTRAGESKQDRALHGLTRSLVNNMVIGVTDGFKKTLEVNGIGYRAELKGKTLHLSLGLSHPVTFDQPEGITFEVPTNNRIIVKGADKQLVGEMAAKIRACRVPDPYKGKGIKYDYEVLRLKEGKTGAK